MQRCSDGGDGEDRLGPVRPHDPVDEDVVVPRVDPHHIAAEQQRPVLLEEGDPRGDLVERGVVDGGEVPLDPEMAEDAVPARNDRWCIRPVECERSEAMCEPMSSGGTSWAVQRSMC